MKKHLITLFLIATTLLTQGCVYLDLNDAMY